MVKKESKLKGILIKESDWIPGNQKPKKDYEEVIAYNGKELFMAYVITANKRYEPDKTERIWQRTDSHRTNIHTSEADVKFYLTEKKLFKSLPKK